MNLYKQERPPKCLKRVVKILDFSNHLQIGAIIQIGSGRYISEVLIALSGSTLSYGAASLRSTTIKFM